MTTVSRRTMLSLALLACWPLAGLAFGAPEPKARPNILYIMTDDHAAHAISGYGSRVNQTPNLDRLAKEGMRFDNCFCVNSICTPSRADDPHRQVQPHQRRAGLQPLRRLAAHRGQVSPGGRLLHRHDRQVAPGQRPDRLRLLDAFCRARASTSIRCSSSPSGRRVIKGYVTDIITDLAIDFLKNRPKDKPFFLMCHHKAPHRPWEPDEKHRAMFAGRHIPEPATLRDDYATRTDAIRECQQKVFDDLTRRDLKLVPPADLDGPGAQAVAQRQADGSRDRGRRQEADAHRRGAERLEIPALHAGLPGLRAVGRRQRRPAARLARPERPGARTRSSSTPATRASSSATTACSTSGSCTRHRSGCRSWSAGRA